MCLFYLLNDIDEIYTKEFLAEYGFDKLVDAQPTAYNVEKVVTELEEKQVQAEKDMQLSDDYASANTYGGMMLAYDLAIPIVRNGGKE